MKPDHAVQKVGMVVEGISAIPAAMRFASKYGIEMPIVEAVNAVINEDADVKETVGALMQRDKKPELPKSAFDLNFEHTVIKKQERVRYEESNYLRDVRFAPLWAY